MAHQAFLEFRTQPRGMSNITRQVAEIVAKSGIVAGLAHVFVRHTSCALTITENADPDVRRDLETLAQRWAPDADPAYLHDLEGDDDMAAHARSVLTDSSVTVPVGNGRLLLGTWQGIYLCEFRNRGGNRRLMVSIYQ